MRNAELYLKGATLSNLRATCGEIARTNIKVGKSRLLLLALFRIQERMSEKAFN